MAPTRRWSTLLKFSSFMLHARCSTWSTVTSRGSLSASQSRIGTVHTSSSLSNCWWCPRSVFSSESLSHQRCVSQR